MATFVVVRAFGPAYEASVTLEEQAGWGEHAAFMEGLVDEGFVRLGGLLGDGTRALLVCDAPDERTVRARLADDPWPEELLELVSVEPWEIRLGSR